MTSDLSTFMSILEQYGPLYGILILVIIFFLWQGWHREQRMHARINKLEDEQRKVLLPLVKKCARIIARNTVVMKRLESAFDHHNHQQP
jgi:hypothetical protein